MDDTMKDYYSGGEFPMAEKDEVEDDDFDATDEEDDEDSEDVTNDDDEDSSKDKSDTKN